MGFLLFLYLTKKKNSRRLRLKAPYSEFQEFLVISLPQGPVKDPSIFR